MGVSGQADQRPSPSRPWRPTSNKRTLTISEIRGTLAPAETRGSDFPTSDPPPTHLTYPSLSLKSLNSARPESDVLRHDRPSGRDGHGRVRDATCSRPPARWSVRTHACARREAFVTCLVGRFGSNRWGPVVEPPRGDWPAPHNGRDLLSLSGGVNDDLPVQAEGSEEVGPRHGRDPGPRDACGLRADRGRLRGSAIHRRVVAISLLAGRPRAIRRNAGRVRRDGDRGRGGPRRIRDAIRRRRQPRAVRPWPRPREPGGSPRRPRRREGEGAFDPGFSGGQFAALDGGGLAIADNAGYIDSAIIRSRIRMRYDVGYGLSSPDRGEFFYAKCGCFALRSMVRES